MCIEEIVDRFFEAGEDMLTIWNEQEKYAHTDSVQKMKRDSNAIPRETEVMDKCTIHSHMFRS